MSEPTSEEIRTRQLEAQIAALQEQLASVQKAVTGQAEALAKPTSDAAPPPLPPKKDAQGCEPAKSSPSQPQRRVRFAEGSDSASEPESAHDSDSSFGNIPEEFETIDLEALRRQQKQLEQQAVRDRVEAVIKELRVSWHVCVWTRLTAAQEDQRPGLGECICSLLLFAITIFVIGNLIMFQMTGVQFEVFRNGLDYIYSFLHPTSAGFTSNFGDTLPPEL